uniref:Lactose synthase B protein n=1 Tax=Monodelphis domestica TaxID=13616 RepID=A0A5F8G1P2_MONDO
LKWLIEDVALALSWRRSSHSVSRSWRHWSLSATWGVLDSVWHLGSWRLGVNVLVICVTFHSSGFNTQIKVSNNGNTEYGIFQISNNGWCAEKQEDVAKSTCGILCSKLLDDDINDDIVCAKKIIEQPKGIDYWKAHKTFCLENLDQWRCLN